jgi:hypothetical protein
MKTIDLLILIIYVTLMVYVAYQARENLIEEKKKVAKLMLDGKIIIEPDRVELAKALKSQLEPLNLDEYIEADLGKPILADASSFNQLSLTVKNLSQTYAVFVDWGQSTLTTLSGQANSLALINPATGLNQAPSLIPPYETLKENFSIAHLGEGLVPLIDSNGALKKLNDRDNPIESLTIRLRLVLMLQPVSNYAAQDHLLAISCPYHIRLATPLDILNKK